MLTEHEIIEEISKLIRRQFDESQRQIQEALDDSSIDTDYYGEVRSMIRQFMSLVEQQQEERHYVYKTLLGDRKPNDPTTQRTT